MVACRRMQSEPDLAAPTAVVLSWSAASMALPASLLVAVVGQAIGAMAGGCSWIGFSVPLHRPVWALVNQPVLNFASLPAATGYWLGSLLLPLLVGVLVIGLFPRPKGFFSEMTAIQLSWAAATVGCAWLPLLDRHDGHLARWLEFQGLPPVLVWFAPATAAAVGLVPTLHLLQLARRKRKDLGRAIRLVLVLVHLGVPTCCTVVGVSLVRGSLPVESVLAITVPVLAAAILAWLRYPQPYPRVLEPARTLHAIVLLVCAGFLGTVLWAGGRPLPDDRAAGIAWAQPQAFNNVRPWIAVTRLFPEHQPQPPD